jgi:Tol biopolymer transport system component
MRLASGTQVGPFQILSTLGAGGMGEVYRARDVRLDRVVALKFVLDSGKLDPDRDARVKAEARAISRVTHPHICALYDIAEQDGQMFLVMEYVQGETLANRLARGPLQLDEVVRHGIEIAEALAAAHSQGIVHRDLKPGNIMLTRDGVKLLDFGLAKLRRDNAAIGDTALTASLPTSTAGVLAGTLPYMAPEQLEGRAVDGRADVFALGTVLYEMIAGTRPFHGSGPASTLAAILTEVPTALQTFEPSIPPILQRLIFQCLEKDPDNRWQSARDLASELTWIAEGVSRGEQAAQAQRRRFASVAALFALLLAAIAIGLATYFRTPARAVATYTPVTFRRGAVSAARFTPDGQNIVYSASWEGRPYEMFLGREGSADARSLGLVGGRILSISPASDLAVVFGLQNITHLLGQSTLARIPLAGGTRRDLLEGVTEADWIPNRDELAVVRIRTDDSRSIVEFPAGTKVHEARAAWSLRVSPDGQRLAFFEGPFRFGTAPKAMITVIDRSGKTSTLTKGWAGIGLAWNPSGSEIWFTATHGERPPALQAVSLSGSERQIHAGPDWLVLHDVSRDGRSLMTVNSVQLGVSCQPGGETAERDLTWIGGSTVRDISADGQTLIFTEDLFGAVNGTPRVFRRSLDGSPAVNLGLGAAAALSPDGKWVLTSLHDEWTLLAAGAGASRTLPMGSVRTIGAAAWLPDGRGIVFAGSEREWSTTLRIFVQDVDGGPPRPITPDGVTLPAHAGATGAWALGRSDQGWSLYPLNGGAPRSLPALRPQDDPVRWTVGGESIYVVDREPFWSTSRDLIRVDVATGKRTVVRTLAPADSVGLDNINEVTITPDGRAYCYTYLRRLGRLFTVAGLQ